MNKKILIMKTGGTIPGLLTAGENFEDWFVRGFGEESGLFHCSAIDLGQDLPDLDTIMGVIITGSPAYVTDLAPWNYLAADFFAGCTCQADTDIRSMLWTSIAGLGFCRGSRISS